MKCEDVRPFIEAYLDMELGLETSLIVEKHLSSCEACRTLYENRKKVRAALQSSGLYGTAPTNLRMTVLSSIGESHPDTRTVIGHASSSTVRYLRGLSLAASLALVGVTGWVLGRTTAPTEVKRNLTQEVFTSDVRSLMATNHGIDVLSSDKHTVKPWFAGKLDFSPQVQDFKDRGFILVGGRRDYVNGRVVAVVVYKRRQHWINLYVWPDSTTVTPIESSYQGYNLIHWSRNGMANWAVSDLNNSELRQFTALVQTEH